MLLHVLIDRIDALRNELSALQPISNENKDRLEKKFRLEFHYNTNHIEGNTLTYSETELFFLHDATRGNHTAREYEEMRASDAALNYIQEYAQDQERPITENFIKELNRILLVRPFYKEAITQDGQSTQRLIDIGEYKKYPNSVRLSNGEIFNYAMPHETPSKMTDLLDWHKNNLTLHPVELAAKFHYKFVCIHPFDDGNGRISRLLMNYVFYKNMLPGVIIKSSEKNEYLNALRDADVGNENSFTEFIANQLIEALQLSIKAAKGERIDEDEDWRKRLKLLKDRLSTQDSINIVKSNDSITNFFNETIFPTVKFIKDALKDYDELFLTNHVSFNTDDGYVYWTDGMTMKDASFFLSMFSIDFNWLSFKKNGEKTFNISINLFWLFNDYSYSLYLDNNLANEVTNEPILYHKKIDPKILANKIGDILLEQIESKIS